jgi:hypothetical protein
LLKSHLSSGLRGFNYCLGYYGKIRELFIKPALPLSK